jgi:hypothetical protein
VSEFRSSTSENLTPLSISNEKQTVKKIEFLAWGVQSVTGRLENVGQDTGKNNTGCPTKRHKNNSLEI